MVIKDDFLTTSMYTRPGFNREATLAVVLHWVDGRKKQTAKNIRDYFESLNPGPKFASIQYVVGYDGAILRLMKEDERAYHVGHAGKVDPVSGQFYTNYARNLFGKYATDYTKYSPSYCTIGIEMCHNEDDGRFSKETLASTLDLCEMLFKKYKLDPAGQLTTHERVVGHKFCPLWFHTHPEDLEDFRHGLTMRLRG